jgi:hypothetical protein
VRLNPVTLALLPIALASCARPVPQTTDPAAPSALRGISVAAVTTAFQVTQTTAGSQDHPAVAANDSGLFWVVWHTDEQAASYGLDVKARVFDPAGTPLTPEFVVSSPRGRNQMYPDVATDGSGLFAVAWMEQTTADTFDIWARVFTSMGAPLTPSFKVSGYPSHAKTWPSIAMYPSGDILVIWDDAPAEYVNVYVRLFTRFGFAITDPEVINLAELNQGRDVSQEHLANVVPDIAVDASGWAFGAWRRFAGSTVSAVGRLFNPYTGVWLEETMFAPPADGVVQQRPTVDINDRGDALVAWTEWPPFAPSRVMLRRYDGASKTWGTPWAALEGDPYAQSKIIAVLNGGGQVAAAWTAFRSGTREDIYARAFDPEGAPLTNAVRANDYTTGKQDRPSIALIGSRLLTAWESWDEDGDNRGVYAKILQRGR